MPPWVKFLMPFAVLLITGMMGYAELRSTVADIVEDKNKIEEGIEKLDVRLRGVEIKQQVLIESLRRLEKREDERHKELLNRLGSFYTP